MYSTKCFNSNYTEFFDFETCDKLIWTPGECCRHTNTTRKQGIPKININKKYPPSTLGFICFTHKDTCDILSEYLVSHILQAYS